MEALRAVCVGEGLSGVSTLIASGNVLFDLAGPAAAVESRLEGAFARAFGFEVATFIRTAAEVDDVIAGAPDGTGMHAVHAGVLKRAPSAEQRAATLALATPDDLLHLSGRTLYWTVRHSTANSKLTMPRLEKALGGPVTFRNLKTYARLSALLAGG
jgi:uncharacterized protein (DUF1697 family)